jgi:ferredoxin-NADP reductase
MSTFPASPNVGADSALRVVAKSPIADGVVSLTLLHPDGKRLPDWAPGAHIDLVLPNGVTRQYSLCGDRWDAYTYRVAVLRERAGRGGSAFVHDALTEGDMVGVGGPRNNFGMVPSEGYLFIAGGIGITPILPMIAQADLLGTQWRLLYVGRTRETMGFLDELAGYGDRVVVAPRDEVGRLHLESWLGSAESTDTKVYVCGPSSLSDAMESRCSSWPLGKLRTERFVAREFGAPARSTPFDVELTRSRIEVTVPPNRSVLEAVQAAGVNVLSSCQEGTCGTCETTVLAGVPDHRDSILEDDERSAGDCMFICVSRACSDRLVLEL